MRIKEGRNYRKVKYGRKLKKKKRKRTEERKKWQLIGFDPGL